MTIPFQSTQPKRAATSKADIAALQLSISIHAAQEGCDHRCYHDMYAEKQFQSTQPKRAATEGEITLYGDVVFQSTQPKRAATDGVEVNGDGQIISIHAAQEGCDWSSRNRSTDSRLFQSTQPKRAATPTTSDPGNWI